MASGLDEAPASLEEGIVHPTIPLPSPDPLPNDEVALLLHLDDLHAGSLLLGKARVARVGGLLAHAPGAAAVAMNDALVRAAAHLGCLTGPAADGWSDGLPVVTAWAPVGPSAEALPGTCARTRRRWDDLVWPHATRGFFQVRKAIPSLLGLRDARWAGGEPSCSG